MDVKPSSPAGKQYIERYGPGGFRISGSTFTDAVLVFPEETVAWPVNSMAEITPESLRPVAERGGVEILLIGCGHRMQLLPKALKEALRQVGIVADAMDTAAACRTYNVLLLEERRVAAAMLPIRD